MRESWPLVGRDEELGHIVENLARPDRPGAVLGKSSFSAEQLLDNYEAFLDEMVRQRPAAAKGRYLRNITISSSMGPGIKIDPALSRDLLEEETVG